MYVAINRKNRPLFKKKKKKLKNNPLSVYSTYNTI